MRNDVGTEDLPGEDWRSKAEAKGERYTEDPVAIALERARERGRGREAGVPEAIPPLGWRDILWRVLKGIIEDRILYTSGGVAFFTLLAFFPADVPTNLEKMKGLPRLSYKGAREKLAEKFHMSEDLLQMLNPGKKFDVAGGNIVVANVETVSFPGKVARIEVDKSVQELKVFGRDQQLLAVYPATVGSEEKPAPTGRLTVTGISKNPTYRYNPKYAFKGVHAKEPFTINPGPNNPVGVVWIGLSAEGYGIHGTPDPSKVGKSESHGCVRLTNWDALRLAAGITKGTPVDFSGQEQVASESRRKR
jgi:lipoprotein-anchoring transpeptidase ErfK/SrfK